LLRIRDIGIGVEARFDLENRYSNVGVIMVWRVDGAGNPVERSEGTQTTIVGYGTTTPQKRNALPDIAMWDGKRRIRTAT